MSAEDVALKYKQLWMVEDMFRTAKRLLETRPIYHHHDETIRGHVFCSLLALVLRKELHDRLALAGDKFEWAEILRDLEALQYVEVRAPSKAFPTPQRSPRHLQRRLPSRRRGNSPDDSANPLAQKRLGD